MIFISVRKRVRLLKVQFPDWFFSCWFRRPQTHDETLKCVFTASRLWVWPQTVIAASKVNQSDEQSVQQDDWQRWFSVPGRRWKMREPKPAYRLSWLVLHLSERGGLEAPNELYSNECVCSDGCPSLWGLVLESDPGSGTLPAGMRPGSGVGKEGLKM